MSAEGVFAADRCVAIATPPGLPESAAPLHALAGDRRLLAFQGNDVPGRNISTHFLASTPRVTRLCAGANLSRWCGGTRYIAAMKRLPLGIVPLMLLSIGVIPPRVELEERALADDATGQFSSDDTGAVVVE